MTLADYIPFIGTDKDEPTTETLAELFRQREATLDLTAAFHQPEGNTLNEPTAVFPYTLYDSGGEPYGTGTKEFIIPEDGFTDNDAFVTLFVGYLTDTDTEDVGVETLGAVEGSESPAELTDAGDIIVGDEADIGGGN